jgi:hypothetical protein
LVCTVSGTVKWAQCELGGFATSFIPTAGSTATRAADVAVISGAAFTDFYRQAEGTVLVSISSGQYRVVNGSIYSVSLFCLSDGTMNNFIMMGCIPPNTSFANGQLQFQIYASGTVSMNVNHNVYNGADVSATISFTENDVDGYSSQGAAVSDDSVTIAALNQMTLGQFLAGSRLLNGGIKRIAYWPEKLGNANMQQLTVV